MTLLSRVPPKKLTVTQLVKTLLALYGTQKFITIFTTVSYLTSS